jgi:hypothetical protein
VHKDEPPDFKHEAGKVLWTMSIDMSTGASRS